MAINAYTAKRNLFTLLTAAPALTGLQVSYAYPARDVERVCVYGGGFRFTRSDAAAEPGALSEDTVTLGVYVRVEQMDSDVLAADQEVELVANAIADVVTANPEFAGAMTDANVIGGLGDYGANVDSIVSTLALQVQIASVVGG